MSNVAYGVDWSQQHCGVHQATFEVAKALMPDLRLIFNSFPELEDPNDYTWDVKVHMLMDRQYPCIPDWHVDNVPRVGGVQRHDLIKPDLPMWLWVSGTPLTQFENGYVQPGFWHRFTQQDKHRGSPAAGHGWRGFIRASHKDILPPKPTNNHRRHCQVYLDANNYQW